MATQPDQVNAGALGTIVVVGACAMLGISLAITALVRTEVAAEAEALGKNADSEVRIRAAEQQAVLNAPPAWEDRQKGFIGIPVETAMEVVVEELRQNPYAATPAVPAKDAGAASPDAAQEAGVEAGAAAGDAEATIDAGTETNEKELSEDGAGTAPSSEPREAAQNGGAVAPKAPGAPASAPKQIPPVAPAPKPEQSGSASPAPGTQPLKSASAPAPDPE
jgi:hypothetical protein